jgi:hypothetical protein
MKMSKFLCITIILFVCFSSTMAMVQFQALIPNSQQLKEIVAEFKRKTLEIHQLLLWYFWTWQGKLVQLYTRFIHGLCLPFEMQPVAILRQGRKRRPLPLIFTKKA